MIIRLLNLAALLAAVAWLGSQGGWEPAVTSLALLAGFLYQDLAQTKSGSTHDQKLYEKFLNEFPSNGRSVQFLKNHDMAGSFLAEELEEFDRFTSTWQNAEHEFKNELLGSYLRNLLRKSNEFQNECCGNVFNNHGSVRTMDINDWEDRPDKLRARDKLNALAEEIYAAHQELVRQGRKLL